MIARRRSSSDGNTSLARYDEARRALAEARRVDEVKNIRDKAVAVQAYARQAKDEQLIRHATEIRVRAERRAGELLIEMAARGERQKSGQADGRRAQPSVPKLADLGVSRTQSSRWQAIARIPQEEFERKTERIARGDLDAAVEIRARKTPERHAERINKINAPNSGNQPLVTDCKYAAILADPPWDFKLGKKDASERSVTPYPTMSDEEIRHLPVERLAHEGAALFLWTTNPHLPVAMEVMTAWGFTYVTNVVWVKDKVVSGYWMWNQHQLLLIGKRGDIPAPLRANRAPSVLKAPRRERSRKPDETYELIERMYPDLPKIELFARQARYGWTVWKN